MDEAAGSRWDPRQVVRLVTVGLLGVGVFLAVSVGLPWFRAFFPPSRLRRIVVRLLEAGQVMYAVLLVIVPIAMIGFTAALVRARHRGTRRTGLFRALALVVALLVAMFMAESLSAAWLAWTRVPMPWLKTRFLSPSDKNTVNILVLGASSAFGVPYHEWLSTPEIVAWKLREAFPDRQFAIEYLARPGLTIDKIHWWMQDIQHKPDLVILYSGHNEFQGRYNWGHSAIHYADEMPPAHVTFESFARDHSPLCRLIQDTIEIYRIALPPTRPQVTRQLVDVPVYTADEYRKLVYDFHAHLEAMVTYCERVGALVVLVAPPGNDADYDPSRSFLPAETPRAERESFARAFEAARNTEEADAVGAIAAYRELLASQPGFAEAHYRLARLLEAAGRRDEANAHYVAARDTDGFPMRCPSDFLAAYHVVASRHPGAILIDAPELLRSLSARGTVGDPYFADGLHPSLIGFTELAQAILRGLHSRRALGWPATAPSPSVTPAECAAHFQMDNTKWAEVCKYAKWYYEMTSYIRYDPAERLAKAARFEAARAQLEQGKSPAALGIPGIGTERGTPETLPIVQETSSGQE